MFCRKCGNKLSDNDAFCSKCGAKVLKSSPSTTSNALPAARSESTTRNWLNHPVVRFFLYLIIFVAITILFCATFTPPQFSVMEFITYPGGLARFVGACMGASMTVSLFFLPLLSALKKLEITGSLYFIETFFLLMVVYEFSTFGSGNDFFSGKVMPLIGFTVLFVGVILWIIAWFKKKK